MRRPRFTRWTTANLESLSPMIPPDQRCGIYVLEYDDGTRYIGQAIDVVRRYAQHRHARGPIQAVEFAQVPAADLDRMERLMIGYEEKRGPIRNMTHASAFTGASKLDPIVA